MNDDERNQPLTKGEFQDFLNHHFYHLKETVDRIVGRMEVLIPLTLGIFAAVVTLIILYAI